MAVTFQSAACCNGNYPAPSQTGNLLMPYPTPDYNSEQPIAASCRFIPFAEQLTGQNHTVFNYNIAQTLDVSLLVNANISNNTQPCFTKIYENVLYPGSPTQPYTALPLTISFGQAIFEYPNSQPFDITFYISRRCFGCDIAPQFGKRRKWKLALVNLPYLPDAWSLFNVPMFSNQLQYTTSVVNCDNNNILQK